MKIAIITDKGGWMLRYANELAEALGQTGHVVSVLESPTHTEVDIAFFLSYSHIVGRPILARAKSNIVVHGSDLPQGKGWSPWSWQILEGKNRLPLTLFEATTDVDAGPIYLQTWVEFEGHELIDEWRRSQSEATIAMCLEFVGKFPGILYDAIAQSGEETFYSKRTHVDSQLDANLPIADQFNLLRIADNDRYPAFFEHKGCVYEVKITKRPAGNTK